MSGFGATPSKCDRDNNYPHDLHFQSEFSHVLNGNGVAAVGIVMCLSFGLSMAVLVGAQPILQTWYFTASISAEAPPERGGAANQPGAPGYASRYFAEIPPPHRGYCLNLDMLL
jgi:hypothetical protein